MGRGHVERDVNAVLFKIARDILPEIRELQSGAGRIRESLTLFIAIAAEIEDEVTDWVRGISAVVENRIPTWITLHSLVLPESFQQISERFFRNIFLHNGFTERDKNGI